MNNRRPQKSVKLKSKPDPKPKGKGKGRPKKLSQAGLLHETEHRLEKAQEENARLKIEKAELTTEVEQLRAKIEAIREPPSEAPAAEP